MASLSGTNKRDGLLINFPKNVTSILFYGWLKQVVNIPTNVAEVDEGAIAHWKLLDISYGLFIWRKPRCRATFLICCEVQWCELYMYMFFHGSILNRWSILMRWHFIARVSVLWVRRGDWETGKGPSLLWPFDSKAGSPATLRSGHYSSIPDHTIDLVIRLSKVGYEIPWPSYYWKVSSHEGSSNQRIMEEQSRSFPWRSP